NRSPETVKQQISAQPLTVGQMPGQQLNTTGIPTASSVVHVIRSAKASPLNTLGGSPSREQCDSPDSVITLRSIASGVAITSPRNCTVKDKAGEVIVPSNDKEGWCRNKKYIERVSNGFMCTVCRKVYGRYNSVSYHVT
uniref:C2H2-type domain-containing protein n=1 Tax=Parascaris univalens TaxID=6257 RepID=A0A915BDE7_PARUN